MKPMIREIPNLNRIGKGLQKQWIWGTKSNFFMSCDYLQKVNYCIQDLNAEIKNIQQPTMKEVVFIIVLIDWITEAVYALNKLLIKGIINGFRFDEQERIETAHKFLKAIRSFIVAHPLSTDQHEAYGFDGDKICVDIVGKSQAMTLRVPSDKWYYLDLNGLHEEIETESADFFLRCYSKKTDDMRFIKTIGVRTADLYQVAELYIKKLYALDKYLSKLKKKDWL